MIRRSDGEGDPPAKRTRVFTQQFHRTRGNRVVKSFLYEPETTFADVLIFNQHVHESITELLTEQLAIMQMKVVFTLQVLMLLKNPTTGEEKKATPFFRSKAIILLNAGDIAPAQKEAGGIIEKGVRSRVFFSWCLCIQVCMEVFVYVLITFRLIAGCPKALVGSLEKS